MTNAKLGVIIYPRTPTKEFEIQGGGTMFLKTEKNLEIEEGIKFVSERIANIDKKVNKIKVQVSITKPETILRDMNNAILLEIEDCYRELFSAIRSELSKRENELKNDG